MSTVNIFERGNLGRAVAGLAEQAGHTVEFSGRADADKPVNGDIVVLAVPYASVADIVAERAEQLVGKVVVDLTNPLDLTTFSLTVPSNSSATAQIAESGPTAQVLKALNTNFGPTPGAGTVGDQSTVLIAGDDADAEAQLAELVTTAGLKSADGGPLARARELEALAYLQIGLAASEQTFWTSGFALHS